MPRQGPTSDFWNRLVSLPSFQGKTQEQVAVEVARMVGRRKYSQTAVQKWKSGASLPPTKIVRSIAVHEHVSLEWLQTGRGQRVPTNVDDLLLPELLDVWRRLTIPARQAIVSQAKYYRTINFAGDLEETIDTIDPAKRKRISKAG